MKRRVAKLGMLSNVIFLGSRSDVSRICSASDVMVFPSLFEGLPVSLVEAQANGLMCLVSGAVDRGVKLTDRVEFAELDEGAEGWSSRIDGLDLRRPELTSLLEGTVYDIEVATSHLESLYLFSTNEKGIA